MLVRCSLDSRRDIGSRWNPDRRRADPARALLNTYEARVIVVSSGLWSVTDKRIRGGNCKWGEGHGKCQLHFTLHIISYQSALVLPLTLRSIPPQR